ncbi:hypothetical protein [Niveibacterium sp. SC-1]|uniref:hypothetical protein n=1 Tax=Niveibacterium sp. SC-1 TaxID=3135646 RepID=UPI00311F785E
MQRKKRLHYLAWYGGLAALSLLLFRGARESELGEALAVAIMAYLPMRLLFVLIGPDLGLDRRGRPDILLGFHESYVLVALFCLSALASLALLFAAAPFSALVTALQFVLLSVDMLVLLRLHARRESLRATHRVRA